MTQADIEARARETLADRLHADGLQALAKSARSSGMNSFIAAMLTYAAEREAAAYARAAEVDALIVDLAAQPFGGEVWGRSQALAKFTERARAILALGEAKG